MWVRKVSNSKVLNDYQGHSKSLVLFIRYATYDFLLVFHFSYVSILYRFRDAITHFYKFLKRLLVTWTWTHPLRKFGDIISCMQYYSSVSISTPSLNYLASPISKDMIEWGPKISQMCHVTLTTPIRIFRTAQLYEKSYLKRLAVDEWTWGLLTSETRRIYSTHKSAMTHVG